VHRDTAEKHEGPAGQLQAEIYSANPAVVAASAIKGAIADPREFL